MWQLETFSLIPCLSQLIPFLLFVAYYVSVVCKKPIVVSGPHMQRFLERHMTTAKSKYWPTWWCFEGRLQTVIRSFLKSQPKVEYNRELITTEDGGIIGLDWHANCTELPPDSPIVLVLPGLTGSSAESYVLHIANEASKLGCRCLVFNNRGNGGVVLKTPRTYNATNTDDLALVVHHVKKVHSEAKLLAVGISLGGLILTNYLAKSGSESGLNAGMTVSVPFNVFVSNDSLEQPINYQLFNKYLTKCLIQSLKRNWSVFSCCSSYDLSLVVESKTIREFDDRFTAQQFGYKSWREYYTDACIDRKLALISIPLLCLNAADDPFSPYESIPTDIASTLDNVAIMVTARGGHIGFLEGLIPYHKSFMDRVFSEYVQVMINNDLSLDLKS